MLLTDLQDTWHHYQLIRAASPVDTNGYFTLSSAGDYLQSLTLTDDYKSVSQMKVTHREFWFFLIYCLDRENNRIY
jgi:hypothetical protein